MSELELKLDYIVGELSKIAKALRELVKIQKEKK